MVVGCYPVADELRRIGFDWPSPAEFSRISDLFADDHAMKRHLDRNRDVAIRNLTHLAVADQLREVLDRVGIPVGPSGTAASMVIDLAV